jgi:L-threonylcarbamoyladenylate synthase
VIVALISKSGVPVIGTSANISSQTSALTAQEVDRQLGNMIDLIIDGGKCLGGIESTVLDVTKQVPVILRQGAVSEYEINQCLQNVKGIDKNEYCTGL